MRILMVGGLVPWHPAFGGGYVIAYNLARALAYAGHRIDYVVSAPEHLQRQVEWGELVYTAEGAGLLPTVSRILKAAGDRDLKAYDLIHVHAVGDTFGYYLGYLLRRVLATAPPLVLGIYIPQAYRFPRSFGEASWMSLCRAADVVFALSEFSKRNIAQAYHVPISKISVMYGGVDESFFVSRMPQAEQSPRLLFCGRLAGRLEGRRQQKGIDVLLQAMPHILARHEVRLEIVGEGPLLEAYRAMASELELETCVNFSGFIEYAQMPNHYANADLFVLPSRRESFGLVLAEAMAAGLPVVATRAGAIPEVVQSGQTGILVPSEDPSALAAAIIEFLDHPRKMEDMGAQGRRRVKEYFTWNKVAERVLAAYDSVR